MSRNQDQHGDRARRRPYSPPAIESEEVPKAVVLDCPSIDLNNKGEGCMLTVPPAT